jgi:uncharacterized membrane protein
MESKAKLFGHAIHPMLIPFPLGLLATAAIFDVIYLFSGVGGLVTASFWSIAAGVVGGLVAAMFGLWDWLAIPGGTRAKAIGLWHGAGNVVVTALFVVAWFLRSGTTGNRPDGLPLILEVAGALLALATGWLGGELVERLGVGVDEGANLDAPNSLSGRPAGAGE